MNAPASNPRPAAHVQNPAKTALRISLLCSPALLPFTAAGKKLEPLVQSAPLGRQFVIEGLGGADEAKALAIALNTPLKYPLKVVEERTVSPELAKEAKMGQNPAAPRPEKDARKNSDH